MKKVAVIMGSASDLPIVEKSLKILESFEVPFEVHIYSAHRTPETTREFAISARDQGFGVIIAAAGKAAHLAGVIASHTTLPVIGIPVGGGGLLGLDALLSVVQMPSGIPVASMGVDGAENAGLFAIAILAITHLELAEKLERYREEKRLELEQKDAQLAEAYKQGE